MMVTPRRRTYTFYIISTQKQQKYAINMINIHKMPEKVIYIEPSSKGLKMPFIWPQPKESKFTSYTFSD